VTLRPRPRGITVRCDHPDVPADDSNLAVRAARELCRETGVSRGVAILITKRIPVARGLGGGSSNAAAVLVGLDRLWRLGLGPARLQPLARRLGADVPFFLVGGTALGLGRGDEVYPLRRQLRVPIVVVDPGRPISTPAVFARLRGRLTARENSNTIFRFVSRDLEGVESFPLLANDLERVALEEDPGLIPRARQIRRVLRDGGTRLTLLSGTGSSFFGVFGAAAAARRAAASLRAAGFEAFQARTLTLDQYRGIRARSLGQSHTGPGQTR
jgi:4-diphosphocytidyl-2-C-methyl-D-erythritol kinase